MKKMVLCFYIKDSIISLENTNGHEIKTRSKLLPGDSLTGLCQVQNFLHLGAKISRATMANWIITCSQNYLVYMYEFLHKKLLERMLLMVDETPIQVLKETERRPQSKSYVWVFRTGEDRGVPIILFNHAPTRKGANAANFLKDAPEGYFLMTDGNYTLSLPL